MITSRGLSIRFINLGEREYISTLGVEFLTIFARSNTGACVHTAAFMSS